MGHVHSIKHKGHDQRDKPGMFEGHDQSKNEGSRPEQCSRVTSEVKVQGSRRPRVTSWNKQGCSRGTSVGARPKSQKVMNLHRGARPMGHDPGKKVINPPIRGTVTSLLTSPQLQKEDGPRNKTDRTDLAVLFFRLR